MKASEDLHTKSMLDARQKSLKIYCNAIYGVTNLVWNAFSGAVTWRGRNLQKKMTMLATSIKYGCLMVAGPLPSSVPV